MSERLKLIAGSHKWIAIFALVFSVSCVTPVLADSPPAEDAPVAINGQPVAGLPGGRQVAEGFREAEVADVIEEAKRETASATEEREESLESFADISPAESSILIQEEFADQLALINEDPARMLTDASIDQVLTPTAARITADGNTMLLDGTMPVRVSAEGGDLSKVDLNLIASGEGFTQVNPLVRLELPSSASNGVFVGDDGLSLKPVLTEGASVARRLGDKDLFYPETQTDTDLLAMPTESGVELFSQLRSVESPEELRFDLTLPSGAVLRDDGNGGAQIARNDEILARVPSPTAIDAQATEVPVSMHVEGNELILKVAHRSMDVAYPLLVDPAIAEDWATYGTTSWYSGWYFSALTDGTWAYTSSDWGRFMPSTTPIYTAFGGSNRGLFISAKSIAETQWAYRNGQWSYTVPGQSTYIVASGVNPLWRDNHGCAPSKYPEPHDYIGLWSPAWSGQYGWMYFQSDASQAYGYAFAEPPHDWRQYTAQVFIIGLGTGIYNTAANPCWRDLYAGGAYVWMEDPDQPFLYTAPASTWMDKTPARQAVSATDNGLGVKRFKTEAIGVAGTPTWETINSCTGLRAAPCPGSWNLGDASQPALNFDPSAMPEGIDQLRITAYDAGAQPSTTSNTITVRVDHAAPELAVSGSLTEQATLGTARPNYTIKAEAKDGVPGSKVDSQARSGVKNLKFFEDGVEIEPGRAQPGCIGTQSCSATREYEIPTLSRSVGNHLVMVTAEDALGHKATREVPFTITRDTKAPTISVTNLPAGGLIGPHPQNIVAKASDPDRGVTSLALLADGKVVEEVKQACPKGGCSFETAFAPDLSELASGSHSITIRAEDEGKNVGTLARTETLDNSPPTITLSGSLMDHASMPLEAESATLSVVSKDSGAAAAIKMIDIELDESEVSGYPVNCVSACSEFKNTYKYLSSVAGPGEHTVSVEASDQVGNRTSRVIAVNVPSQDAGTPACSDEVETRPAVKVVSAAQAAIELKQVLPQALAPSEAGLDETGEGAVDPSFGTPNPDLQSLGSLAETETSIKPNGGVTLDRIACLSPGQTTSAASNAAVVDSDSAIFANTDTAVDTTMRPTATGMLMIRSIKDPKASDTYSWNVTVHEGEQVVQLPSGAIAIVEEIEDSGKAASAPSKPTTIKDPKALVNAEAQRVNSEYEIAKASTETSAVVVAVIAEPWILLADKTIIPAPIEVAPVIYEPNEYIVTVRMPDDELAAALYPLQIVESASVSTAGGGCPGGGPCGSPNLDHAAQYAVYWGNPSHTAIEGTGITVKARNPYYLNFGDNNCTNFISQILRAGDQKFMLFPRHGDGSWWYKRAEPWIKSAKVNFAPGEYTESWAQADKLPRHLWRYGLVHIDPVNEPSGWTKGNILAEDWYVDGKGTFSHMQFVVGTESVNGIREPLIANESSEGANYSALLWERVKLRIQAAEPAGWSRVPLAWKHTAANINEKKHDPDNLYGPNGVFQG